MEVEESTVRRTVGWVPSSPIAIQVTSFGFIPQFVKELFNIKLQKQVNTVKAY